MFVSFSVTPSSATQLLPQPVLTPASIHLVPLSSELSKFQYLIFEPHLQGGVIKYCNTKKQIATVGQRVSVPNWSIDFA